MTVQVAAVPQVTVHISGGLGNQLFQYAAARSHALRQSAELVLDVSFYDKGRHRQFELDQFPIRARIAGSTTRSRWLRPFTELGKSLLRMDQREYNEPHFAFDPSLLERSAPVVLHGYFQSQRYFDEHADSIREELAPPSALDQESQRLAAILTEPGSVSVHVRRGDYITNPKAAQMFHECSPNYYAQALERFPRRAPVVVFSDDINWAKQNLRSLQELAFAGMDGPRAGLADLWLMTLAENHVIANSSFSWWGAWLSKRSGTTIAPRQWFRTTDKDTSDLIPADWIQL